MSDLASSTIQPTSSTPSTLPDVLHHLLKWWSSAKQFLDKDKSATLDKEEYGAFYTRLTKLVDEDADDELDEEEVRACK